VHVNLRSDRLTLRPWDPDDTGDVQAAYDIYRRDEVARWLGSHPQPWESLEQAQRRLQRWQDVAEAGLGLWAITLNRHDPPVGTALLVRLPDRDGELTDDVEIGWHLHPDCWGNGYATEAAQRLLEHAWDLDIAEVNAVAHPGNDRSVAVMERLGLEPQGATDRWYGVTLDWWLVEAPLPPAA
jgi:RimJ/RimL family protein N-acetyltransferase